MMINLQTARNHHMWWSRGYDVGAEWLCPEGDGGFGSSSERFILDNEGVPDEYSESFWDGFAAGQNAKRRYAAKAVNA